MSLDITALIIIALFFIRGYMRGLIVAVFSVVAILLGIVVSLKMSQVLASYLLAKGYVGSGWAPVLSYLILFTAVVIAVRWGAKLLQRSVEGMMLGTVNKIIGGLLFAFVGLLLWSSFLWIGIKLGAITPEAVAASVSANQLQHFAPWVFSGVGVLLPFAKNTFTELQRFYSHIPNK